MNTQNNETRERTGLSLRGVLIATALMLTAGILLRAGGVGGERTALAGMVADSGSYTAMTAMSGSQEILFVIDDRSENLMVYTVQNGTSVSMDARQDLRALFSTARASYLGTTPGQGRP